MSCFPFAGLEVEHADTRRCLAVHELPTTWRTGSLPSTFARRPSTSCPCSAVSLPTTRMSSRRSLRLSSIGSCGTSSRFVSARPITPRCTTDPLRVQQCPLLELDSSPSDDASPVGSPVPSRYTALPLEHGAEPSPNSTHFNISDDSGSTSTPPPTSKTSPSNTEVSDVPRISATTFTSLLGALLTDQSSMVAKSTESALVRFLCRLKGKPLPLGSTPPSPVVKSTACADPADFLRLADHDTTHQHHPYHLGPEACRVLEDEFVTGIVLGLARLDDDERDAADKSKDEVDLGSSATTTRRAPSAAPAENTPPMTLVLSPEEEQIEDGWLSGGAPSSGRPFDTSMGSSGDVWGAPLTSFFDDGLDRVNGSDAGAGSSINSNGEESIDYGQAGVIPRSSPSEPMYSTFSPDGHGDEESAIGKMVSMSLIGAIAAAECLETEVLVQQILPEVDRMKTESMFYVRKEATQALGSLARTLPVEVLESVVVSVQLDP